MAVSLAIFDIISKTDGHGQTTHDGISDGARQKQLHEKCVMERMSVGGARWNSRNIGRRDRRDKQGYDACRVIRLAFVNN